jgi:hypothetical protein
MRFYKNFDRLEFYYYHKYNLTVMSKIFLSSIYAMQQSKGTLIQTIAETY